MAIRKLIQVGDPILKQKNQKISSFGSKETKGLIKDLVQTMVEYGLIGIAAPQIARNFKVFVTYARNTSSRKLEKKDKLRVYINPKINFESKEKTVIFEGCGSVLNDLFGPVLRPREIEVEAYDQNGKKFSLRCDGLLARVIQHEMDHLNGIEFIEKVNDYSKIMTGKFYRKFIKNSKLQKNNSVIKKIEVKYS